MVLNGDGRILTALSRVTPGQLFVRYANGTLETARVGHSDPVRDLALLVPKTARWQKGLPAARDGLASPTSTVVGFSLGANRALSSSPQALTGTAELAGHTVLKLSSAPKPAAAPAPAGARPPGAPRKFLSLYFACAHAYGRAMKCEAEGCYRGRCPKCGKTIDFPIGQGGTSRRMFEVRCD